MWPDARHGNLVRGKQGLSTLFDKDAETQSLGGAVSGGAPLDVALAAPMLAPPDDTLFAEQWHLSGTWGINVQSVWEDYTGAGVKVAVYDTGIDWSHPDLAGRVDRSRSINAITGAAGGLPVGSDDSHGTAVAGLIAAARNGSGAVGVAYDATLQSIYVNFGIADPGDDATAFNHARQYADVMNNSWGYAQTFSDDFGHPDFAAVAAALVAAAEQGRDGLGTVMVTISGNGRLYQDDANYHSFSNDRHVITVAASDADGSVADYSSPGASILVTAPSSDRSSGITTTDRVGGSGYSPTDFTTTFGGTSAAGPQVAGVVALMLEANPALGYRDVQEILAYSARQTDMPFFYEFNGARNWNGGGLHFHEDFGAGLVDARAAVRLAETWTTQHTAANEQVVTRSASPELAIRDTVTISSSIANDTALDIDSVEIAVDLSHTARGDLLIQLVSPSGVTSTLMARPWALTTSPHTGEANWLPDSRDDLQWTFSSTQHWGEDGVGTWTLKVYDFFTGDGGTLHNWTLRLYGDAPSVNDTYYYTDEFSEMFSRDAAHAAQRASLNDGDGGIDTINAAALSGAAVIDLGGGTSSIDGHALAVAAGVIENVYAGDGNDTLFGSAVTNTLYGGRGGDTLFGGNGNDTLQGDAGNDTLSGGGGADRFVFRPGTRGTNNDLILDFTPGSDLIDIRAFRYASIADMQAAGDGMIQDGTDVVLTLATDDQPVTVRIVGIDLGAMTASSFVFNEAPVALADTNGGDAVVEAGVNPDYSPFVGDPLATGNVLANDTDADVGDSKLVTTTGTFIGAYGALILSANGTWSYALNNTDPDTNALAPGQVAVDVFDYTMRDAKGATSSSTLTIGITGTSDRPSPLVTIETAGATGLTAGANRYFLENGGTPGPTLKYLGAEFVAGQAGGWAPIGAEASPGGGYNVAWKMAGADQYTVWRADSSGNYASSVVGVVSGGSYALQALEAQFAQDLNRDGTTGLATAQIEAAGAIGLIKQADRYAIESGGVAGPSLKYLGVEFVAGQAGGWAPIGAEAAAGGGYNVAWKVAGADQYTVWRADSGGNYASSVVGVVSGGSYVLQALEAQFAQDLNGDGTLGVAMTQIEAFGATSLSAGASRYFLGSGGTPGPMLKYLGVEFVEGQAGGWAPIGAEAVAGGGYNVAWKVTGADQYTVWRADSGGNYASSLVGLVSGGSYALQLLEAQFAQDLNRDGTIGVSLTQIEAFGATSLSAGASRYFLGSGGAPGPTLKYLGMDLIAGQAGGWAPIGAEAVAGGGYNVTWKTAGADQYTVWNADSSGNYVSSRVGVVSGGSYALQSLETIFAQDLNSDGTMGPVTSQIEAAGATGLVKQADLYFVESGGAVGPSLKYLGAAVTAGSLGGWAPIGAEAAAGGGYNVVWKMAGADQYTVWNADGSGNYASSLVGVVSGGSYALQELEGRFAQDLNGDGTIGLTAVQIETVGATSLIRKADRYFLEDGGTPGPTLKYLGTTVTAGALGAWTPIGAEAAVGGYDVVWKVIGADQYTAWHTDSGGDYVSSLIGLVSGSDPALVALEARFGQDLNSSGVTLYGGDGNDTLYGQAGNDALYGGDRNDRLFGGDGHDTLFGGEWLDSLYGGAGNDTLFGGALLDSLFGGAGDDTLSGDASGAVVSYVDVVENIVADLVSGTATGEGNDVLSGIGSVFGGRGNDTLTGDGAANSLAGDWGDDTLWGGGGTDQLSGDGNNDVLEGNDDNDWLRGGTGNDTLYGGAGDDRLFGEGGDDTLVGGLGNDVLTGDIGADLFAYSAGAGNDVITDFNAAEGDKVNLNGVTFASSLNNVATLSDGATITAQTGYVWTGSDFT